MALGAVSKIKMSTRFEAANVKLAQDENSHSLPFWNQAPDVIAECNNSLSFKQGLGGVRKKRILTRKSRWVSGEQQNI